jgi:hypothetical protein
VRINLDLDILQFYLPIFMYLIMYYNKLHRLIGTQARAFMN